jgi:hypothetical protein
MVQPNNEVWSGRRIENQRDTGKAPSKARPMRAHRRWPVRVRGGRWVAQPLFTDGEPMRWSTKGSGGTCGTGRGRGNLARGRAERNDAERGEGVAKGAAVAAS